MISRLAKPLLAAVATCVLVGCNGQSQAANTPSPSAEISLPPASATSHTDAPSTSSSMATPTSAATSAASPARPTASFANPSASTISEAETQQAVSALDSWWVQMEKLYTDPSLATDVLTEVASGDALGTSEGFVADVRKGGHRASGNATWVSKDVVSATSQRSMDLVRIRACQDVSKLRILDSAGKDVTPKARINRMESNYLVTRASDSKDSWTVNHIDSQGKRC